MQDRFLETLGLSDTWHNVEWVHIGAQSIHKRLVWISFSYYLVVRGSFWDLWHGFNQAFSWEIESTQTSDKIHRLVYKS